MALPVGATSAWTSTRMRPAALERRRDDAARRRGRRARRGTPGPDRRAPPGRSRPSRRRRPPRSTRSGSSTPAGGAAWRSARRRASSTASTRCSSVFGPASVPSLVTWPTRTTAIPSPLASSMSRSADSRTWPTLPAGAVELVDASSSGSSRRSTSAGRSARASSAIRPTSLSRDDPDGPAGRAAESRPRRDARRRTWARRLLARRVEDPAALARRAAGDAGGDLEQERRLADARLAADEEQRSRDEPATEDAIELADPDGQPRDVGRADVGERGRWRTARAATALAEPPRVRPGSARGRPSRRGCSSRRTSGTGPPSGGTTRRRTGRRSGSGPWPRVDPRTDGQAASTGIFASPRRGCQARVLALVHDDRRARLVRPSRRCSARTSSIMFWITRRSGRAP